MITYKFFVDNFGVPEQEARTIVENIRNSKHNSIHSIVRLFDETLKQKFDYYMKELGFTFEELIAEPRLLTFDTITEPADEINQKQQVATDDKTKKKSGGVKTKVEFLRKTLDFSNEDIRACSMLSYDIETMIDHITFLKKTFGFENEHIKSEPSLLNNDPATLLKKVEFYKKHLGFTNKQFLACPQLLSYDCDENSKEPKAVINKLKFYRTVIGIRDASFRSYPKLLSYDTVSDESVPTSVRAKMKFYHDELGFEPKHFQKAPHILGYDCITEPKPKKVDANGNEIEEDYEETLEVTSDGTKKKKETSAKTKIKFFREFLGFENEHFQKEPGVLAYDISKTSSPTAVRNKVAFYENTIGLTKKHIRENPLLFHFDCVSDESEPTSVRAKLKALYEIGLTNEDIQADTRLLTTPAQDLKPKFVLWSTIFPDKSFLALPSWYVTRPEKIYARFQFLTREYKDKNLIPNHLNHCESQFQKRFKQDSESIMQRYPLTEEIMAELFEQYKQMGLTPELSRE